MTANETQRVPVLATRRSWPLLKPMGAPGSYWVRVCLLVSFTTLTVSLSHAQDLEACITRKVSFDGIVRLSYATVKAPSGPRLYLHAQYPNECSSGKEASCRADVYLIPGNTVAIGKGCGHWDYVQYIGERRISEGWVESRALSPVSPPRAIKAPTIPPGGSGAPPVTPSLYTFQLTVGKGKPVCEAYLQRLNQTEFYSPPYCGRPESTLVPGFALLHRRYLTNAEFQRIFFDAGAVLSYDPIHYDYKPQRKANGAVVLVPPYNPIYPGFTPGAWIYDPPVDIENSGRRGNVIMWTTEDRYSPQCSMPGNPDGSNVRGSIAGLVVLADRRVDRPATYDVFGMSDLAWYSQRTVRDIYPEFSREFGVFRYRNLTYFDAFLTGSRNFEGSPDHRTFDPKLKKTLAVFLYAQGERREICEYYVPGLEDRK